VEPSVGTIDISQVFEVGHEQLCVGELFAPSFVFAELLQVAHEVQKVASYFGSGARCLESPKTLLGFRLWSLPARQNPLRSAWS
jgi:hypothetical protein